MDNEQKFRLALEAIAIADSIMGYSRGDQWERECTQEEYDNFLKIKDQLIEPVKPPEPPTVDIFAWWNKTQYICPECGRSFTLGGLVDHYNQKHETIINGRNRNKIMQAVHDSGVQVLTNIVEKGIRQ